MTTAGDLSLNLSKIIHGFMDTSEPDRRIVAKLAENVGTINAIKGMAYFFAQVLDGGAPGRTRRLRAEMEELVQARVGVLRVFVAKNEDDLVRMYPTLKSPIQKFCETEDLEPFRSALNKAPMIDDYVW